MSRARVFLSFDVDHDADLRTLLIDQSQSGGTGFRVVEQSAGGEPDDAWCTKVRGRIQNVDQLIIICGVHTDASVRMNAELKIANEEQKPHFFLWGRRDLMCTMPADAKRSESMYRWTWETIVEQISNSLQNTQPMGLSLPPRPR